MTETIVVAGRQKFKQTLSMKVLHLEAHEGIQGKERFHSLLLDPALSLVQEINHQNGSI